MQSNKNFIGIDVSKATLDLAHHDTKSHICVSNDSEGFKLIQAWLKSLKLSLKDCWFVLEYTGGYEYRLVQFCASKQITFTRVPGLEIKKSMGIQRGKNDKVDAIRIATYAYEKRDKIQPSNPRNANLERLRMLLSQREGFVNDSKIHKGKMKEAKVMMDLKNNDILIKRFETAIEFCEAMIKEIEKEMMTLTEADTDLNKNFELVTSVPGIGKINAWMTLIYTDNFTRFKDGRKYGSYCGVVPFEHRSGTSIKFKNSVSFFANKKAKASLDMAAKAVLLHETEFSSYYERRKELGKHHMSIMNEIKFKLILRMFAVVNKRTPYEKKQKMAA